MVLSGKSDNRGVDRPTISRADIETICILEAIPGPGCLLSALPGALGLAPTLLGPVTASLEVPLASGWVEVLNGHIQVTSAGRTWLGERKSELQA